MKVPLFDVRREYEALAPELLAAAERGLASGRYILGPEVETFEHEMAAYLGTKHAVGVASGTDALFLALRAAGIGPGDRVLTTPLTFFATASAILNAGATPTFTDIDPETFNLDPEAARSVLEDRSPPHRRLGIRARDIKAIVPVHLFGQPADMRPIMELAGDHRLAVIEDAAQAMGADCRERKAGTFGQMGCFSFFPTKNLGAFGDGGLVVSDGDDLAQRLRLLRAHGATGKYRHRVVGTNSRLDALQAALLRVKLPHLDRFIGARQALARSYDQALRGINRVDVPRRVAASTHTYHQYVIRVAGGRRDAVQEALAEAGVETAVHYPVPLHLQEATRNLGYVVGDFPRTEKASQEAVSLPISPWLSKEEQSQVVQALRRACGTERSRSE